MSVKNRIPPPMLSLNVTFSSTVVMTPVVAEIEKAGTMADFGAMPDNATELLAMYKILFICATRTAAPLTEGFAFASWIELL